ncbi:substrate-binding periplasmic protein [Mulberry dwarf phytoplasma]|uniref:substrate-binding periplasmic protein n=1 Tax=Mulberry dwarf phytoplasma TaxID=186171 RepID=UPI001D11793E|nr:transporter substrate-binding domain-containing protein [Mulberry dwarf phytoplasma]
MQDSNIIGYIRKNKKHILRFNLIHICFWSWVLMHLYVFGVFEKKVTNDNTSDKTDTLVLGTINIMPPLAFDGKEGVGGSLKTVDGQYVNGSDVLFCKALAGKLGYKLDIKVYSSFTGVLNALTSGQVDFIIGSMNNTPRRNEVVKGIDYLKATASILIKKNKKEFFQKFKLPNQELITLKNNNVKLQDNEKIKLMLMEGAVFHIQIEKDHLINHKNNFKYEGTEADPKVLTNPDSAVCVNAVKDGIVDGFITDTPVAQGIANSDTTGELITLEFVDNEFAEPAFEPFGFFIRQAQHNPKVSEEKFQQAVKDVYKSFDQSEQTKYYNENFLKPATQDYIQIKQSNNSNGDKKTEITFWQKVWKTLPTYKKPFVFSFMVAIDSVIVGFLITLLFVKIKIYAEKQNKKNNSLLAFYLYKGLSKLIDDLFIFLNAVPIMVQALLCWNLLSLFGYLKNPPYPFLATPFITTLLVISLNTIANLTNLFMHNIKMLDKRTN